MPRIAVALPALASMVSAYIMTTGIVFPEKWQLQACITEKALAVQLFRAANGDVLQPYLQYWQIGCMMEQFHRRLRSSPAEFSP